MPDLTLEELDRLEKLCAAATPEPWHLAMVPGDRQTVGCFGANGLCVAEWGYAQPLHECLQLAAEDEDIAFIVAAREAVPALLAALRQAWAENARLQAHCLPHDHTIWCLEAALRHILATTEVEKMHRTARRALDPRGEALKEARDG